VAFFHLKRAACKTRWLLRFFVRKGGLKDGSSVSMRDSPAAIALASMSADQSFELRWILPVIHGASRPASRAETSLRQEVASASDRSEAGAALDLTLLLASRRHPLKHQTVRKSPGRSSQA